MNTFFLRIVTCCFLLFALHTPLAIAQNQSPVSEIEQEAIEKEAEEEFLLRTKQEEESLFAERIEVIKELDTILQNIETQRKNDLTQDQKEVLDTREASILWQKEELLKAQGKQEEELQSLDKQIKDTQKELAVIEAKNTKIDEQKSAQIMAIAYSVLGVFLLFLGLWYAKKIVIHLMVRGQNQRRKQSLQKIFNTLIYIIVSMYVIFVVLQQDLYFLPSLAFVGLASAFALRDLFSSFFGWIIISGKRGFRLGDRIVLYAKGKEITGDVFAIHMLTTTIQLVENDQYTGNIYTFPNHFVVSQAIENKSTNSRYVWHKISFELFITSDIYKLKKQALKIAEKICFEQIVASKKNINMFLDEKGKLLSYYKPTFRIQQSGRKYFVDIRIHIPLDKVFEAEQLFTEKVIHFVNKDPHLTFPTGLRVKVVEEV